MSLSLPVLLEKLCIPDKVRVSVSSVTRHSHLFPVFLSVIHPLQLFPLSFIPFSFILFFSPLHYFIPFFIIFFEDDASLEIRRSFVHFIHPSFNPSFNLFLKRLLLRGQTTLRGKAEPIPPPSKSGIRARFVCKYVVCNYV